MRIIGIVAEFNPFHNGHKYIIDTVKNPDDCVIAVMSGNFVQRGDVAVFDKFTRANAALLNGVDMVVELPIYAALSTAQKFAECAVKTLVQSGITHLAFGSESGDISVLKSAADAIDDDRVQDLLREFLDNGVTYARARIDAVREVFGDKIADVLSNPNDILAVEYIRSLPSDIEPIAVKRIGVSHDGMANGDFASAMKIREMIFGNLDYYSYVPNNVYDLYKSKTPANIKNAETAIVWQLKNLESDDFLSYDVSEGLHHRIYSAIQNNIALDDIESAIKTKRYTLARIRRILLSAALDVNCRPCPYIRVIGFNENGSRLMNGIKKPVVTSYKTAKNLGFDEYYEIDAKISDFFALCCKPFDNYNELTTQVLKII